MNLSKKQKNQRDFEEERESGKSKKDELTVAQLTRR
jgi:hypothetical protein